MRVLFLGLVIGLILSSVSERAETTELYQTDAVKQKAPNLEVSLVADKHAYKSGDRIKLEVLLVNTNAVKDIFCLWHASVWLPGKLHAVSSRCNG